MMNRVIKRVCSVYFSPTDTTKKVVSTISETLGDKLLLPVEVFDFTLPKGREKPLKFNENDIVVIGTPVYAGRVPNVLLKFLDTMEGEGAISIPVVVFGNRNYDEALFELCEICNKSGMKNISAGGFVGEHAFSYILGKGRPDKDDVDKIKKFALLISEKIEKTGDNFDNIVVDGGPVKKYYKPQDEFGNFIDIRKVKPKVNENCNNCKKCVYVCPMGSISIENVREYTGICIKCGACIKKCPKNARYYDDEGYLYHKMDLEKSFEKRAEIKIFI